MHSEPKKNSEKVFQSIYQYVPVSNSSTTNQNPEIHSANYSTLTKFPGSTYSITPSDEQRAYVQYRIQNSTNLMVE